MGKLTIAPLTFEIMPDVELFIGKMQYHSTDWDSSLTKEAHARLARISIEKSLADGEGYVAISEGKIEGTCVLATSRWDTAYFETHMGKVVAFYASGAESASALIKKLNEQIKELKFEHVHIVLDSRYRQNLLVFQSLGWRVKWVAMKTVLKTKGVDMSSFPTTYGPLELVRYEPSHLEHLIEIASRLTEYSWLQHEERLPLKQRANYTVELTYNSCTTDFADLCLTLLCEGKPIGFNSSKLFQHPKDVGKARYTYERNTFVDPNLTGKGYGKFLKRAVFGYLSQLVDYITGKVSIHSLEMLRIVEGAGAKSHCGEFYLVFEG